MTPPDLPPPPGDESAARPDAVSGRLVARNTLLNLGGQGAPLLVALVALPVLIERLGDTRFGLLTLAWAVLGYFSLFDLGLGRALTHLIAERTGTAREREIPAAVWTGLLLMLGLGLAGSLAAALASPWMVNAWLDVPAALRPDALRAFYALAASIPVVTTTAGLRGVLEARQRFGIVNAIRLPMGIFTFAGPLLVLPFSAELFPVLVVLAAGRLLAWAAHLYGCLAALPELRRPGGFRAELAQQLLRFGGWMTITNLISPLLVYVDRFLIGVLLSAAAIAFYATPWEVVTKLLIIPAALAAVLFPAFSRWHGTARAQAGRAYYAGLKLLNVLLVVPAALLAALAEPGLRLWLGPEYALQGFRPMQILTLGVFLNGLASMPFALVQGAGRPDVTAKLHLAELPVYALLLWVLVQTLGLTGAAVAWLLRVSLDFVLLFAASRRFVPHDPAAHRKAAQHTFASLLLIGLAMLPLPPLTLALLLLVAFAGYAALTWTYLAAPGERRFLTAELSRYLRWT